MKTNTSKTRLNYIKKIIQNYSKNMLVYIFLALTLTSRSNSALAISEGDFEASFQEKVIPYYDQGKAGTFTSQDGLKISYRKFEIEDETGALIILPGSGIPIFGYAEFIYDIQDLGLSVYVIDHRGQGESDKIVKNPQMAHVKDFNDYVIDVSLFMDTIVNKKPHVNRFLLGESMGGAIGTRYLLKNPGAFSAAILSTPMFGINTGYFPQFLTYRFAQVGCLLGYGECYAPRNEKFRRKEFSENYITQSKTRYEFAQNFLEQHPQLQLGGISYQWAYASLSAIAEIQTNQEIFNFPMLVFKAGKDTVVRNDAIDEFCHFQPHCELEVFDDAFHGILLEGDSTRDRAITKIREFIKIFNALSRSL